MDRQMQYEDTERRHYFAWNRDSDLKTQECILRRASHNQSRDKGTLKRKYRIEHRAHTKESVRKVKQKTRDAHARTDLVRRNMLRRKAEGEER